MKQSAVVILIGLLSMGMGSMDMQDPTQIPEVVDNYAVTVVDQSDVSIALQKFSFDGRTFLLGTLGKAQISIDFERIRSIFFLRQGQDIQGKVLLKNGEVLEISIEKKKPFFGESSFANVRIETQDIKTITFQGKVQNKS